MVKITLFFSLFTHLQAVYFSNMYLNKVYFSMDTRAMNVEAPLKLLAVSEGWFEGDQKGSQKIWHPLF